MIITPKDRRLIGEAIMLLSDATRDQWSEWAHGFGVSENASDVPYEISDIALQALNAAVHDIEWRLQRHDLHEDARSDLLNDLGYIQAVQESLRSENVGH
jgi:hypothetical protein